MSAAHQNLGEKKGLERQWLLRILEMSCSQNAQEPDPGGVSQAAQPQCPTFSPSASPAFGGSTRGTFGCFAGCSWRSSSPTARARAQTSASRCPVRARLGRGGGWCAQASGTRRRSCQAWPVTSSAGCRPQPTGCAISAGTNRARRSVGVSTLEDGAAVQTHRPPLLVAVTWWACLPVGTACVALWPWPPLSQSAKGISTASCGICSRHASLRPGGGRWWCRRRRVVRPRRPGRVARPGTGGTSWRCPGHGN